MSTSLEAMSRTVGAIHDDENIKGFFGEYRFLSNFHNCTIHWEGITYPSTENAYMSSKTLDQDIKWQFVSLQPKEAKRLGRTVQLREDWDEVKFEIMYQLTKIKFSSEPLKSMLLETGDKYLEETNWWDDIIWGVCNGIGENNLGKTLMRVRSELREIENSQLALDL